MELAQNLSSANRLILASASPQRKRILADHHIRFCCRPADIEEIILPSQTPIENVVRLATEKAAAVYAFEPQSTVLGADTIVVSESGEILGKPNNLAEARKMLLNKRGSREQIITGFCLMSERETLSDAEVSKVHFTEFSEQLLGDILISNEWKGVAGALRIEGQQQQKIIKRIEGDLENIIGLPYFRLDRLLTVFRV